MFAGVGPEEMGPVSPTARDGDWRDDIDYLRTELPKRHPNPFFHRPRELFEADLERLRVEVPTLTDDTILIRLQQAVASLGDAHTEVDWRPAVTAGYPLQLRWFSDGLYVTRTSQETAYACGARVTGIGETSIDEAYELVTTVISHDNPNWARFRSSQLLVGMQILRSLEIVPEDGVAAFRLAREDGRGFAFPVHPVSMNAVWDVILAAMPAGDETPLYLRKATLNYWDEWLPGERTLYVKYNLCQNHSWDSFAAFAKRVFALADRELPERLIVDMRNNVGGSDAVIAPLLEGILARPWLNRSDRLFVVIGPQTFSSAVLNAIAFRRMTNATLIGEPTGGNANGYGEVREFRLPKRSISIWHSTKFFNQDAANPGAVEPDIVVTTSSDDYFSKRDPVLDRILGVADEVKVDGASVRRRAVTRTIRRACP